MSNNWGYASTGFSSLMVDQTGKLYYSPINSSNTAEFIVNGSAVTTTPVYNSNSSSSNMVCTANGANSGCLTAAPVPTTTVVTVSNSSSTVSSSTTTQVSSPTVTTTPTNTPTNTSTNTSTVSNTASSAKPNTVSSSSAPNSNSTSAASNAVVNSNSVVANSSAANSEDAPRDAFGRILTSGTSSYYGEDSYASGSNNTAFGRGAMSWGDHSNNISFGTNAMSTGTNSIAFGATSFADGTNTVAIGSGSRVIANDAVAIGSGSSVSASGGIAIGSGAQSLHSNSIAIGSGVTTSRANQIIIGSSSSSITLPGLGSSGLFANNSSQIGESRIVTSDGFGNLGTSYDPEVLKGAINSVALSSQTSAAIAAAFSAVPSMTLYSDELVRCGFGSGGFGSQYAVAGGCAIKIMDRLFLNGALSYSPSIDYYFGSTPSIAGRLGFSFPLWSAPEKTPKNGTESFNISLQKIDAQNQEIMSLKGTVSSLKMELDQIRDLLKQKKLK